MCGLFWKNPSVKGKKVKLDLIVTLHNQQFLGICAEMWRFMPETSKRRWQEKALLSLSAKDKVQLISEIEYLAEMTVKFILS